MCIRDSNLVGEANLTFDGSTVGLNGDIGASNNAWIYSSSGGSGVRAGIAFYGTTQQLSFYTAGSASSNERVIIKQSGEVQIGGVDQGVNRGASSIKAAADASGAPINVYLQEVSGSEGYGLGVDSDGDLNFYNSGATSPTLEIKDDNNLAITDGNLVVASGHGIDFSATGNVGGTSSELLDDYEEGSYTPEFSSGYSSISYHNPRIGYYTRVGNLVHFSIYMYVYQATGDTSQVRITLPFTSASGSARESGCYTVYSTGLMSNASNAISHCTYLIGSNYSYARPCKATNGSVLSGNQTRLGQGANNCYLILAGQMFV